MYTCLETYISATGRRFSKGVKIHSAYFGKLPEVEWFRWVWDPGKDVKHVFYDEYEM